MGVSFTKGGWERVFEREEAKSTEVKNDMEHVENLKECESEEEKSVESEAEEVVKSSTLSWRVADALFRLHLTGYGNTWKDYK